MEPEAGAAAVWSPSGLSLHPEAARLEEAFVAAAFGDGPELRLGDALRQAVAVYLESGGDPSLAGVYNLLGDPAARLP